MKLKKTQHELKVPEVRIADDHSAAPGLSHREGGEVCKVLYVTVDQVSQSTGQRWKQEHAGQTNTTIARLSSGTVTSVGTLVLQIV